MKYVITPSGNYRELKDCADVAENSIVVTKRPDDTYDWVNGEWVKSDRENRVNKELREEAYKKEADPLAFKMLRGEITQEEWLAKIAEIKQRYPKF